MALINKRKKSVKHFFVCLSLLGLMASHVCHAGLARILNGEQTKLFYQEIAWIEKLIPGAIEDLSTYKSMNHHLGNVAIFGNMPMNIDSEQVLFSPEWKNLSIANLEVIDTYIVTSHFLGVIPITYDGEVETSMMPEVVDKSGLFKPYYLLELMSKSLNHQQAKRQPVDHLLKLPNPGALMLSKQIAHKP